MCHVSAISEHSQEGLLHISGIFEGLGQAVPAFEGAIFFVRLY